MSSGVVRLHEQLRAVWKARDKEEPIVRGHLLLGPANDRSVVERWFVLLGHSFFYTIQRDSPEYCGALLTDIFSPVVSRVDEKTLEDFNSPESPPESITQVHVTIAYYTLSIRICMQCMITRCRYSCIVGIVCTAHSLARLCCIICCD